MPRSLRAGALAAGTALAALLLSGCVGGGTASTPTDGTAPAAPPASTAPADPLTEVVALVARPEALELVDGSGEVIQALDYLSPADEAVATLTDLLGAAPAEEVITGGNHNPPGVRYTWGGAGLAVTEHLLSDEERAQFSHALDWPRFSVSFRAAEVGGVQLATSSGAHVEQDWAAVADGIDPALWTCSGLAVEHIEISRGDSGTGLMGVGISERDADWVQSGRITAVHAPVSVADGCA